MPPRASEDEPLASGQEPTGEQKLAAAIVRLALDDARGASGRPARERATAWLLAPNTGLTFWCGIAGLNVDRVRTIARSVLAAPGAPILGRPRPHKRGPYTRRRRHASDPGHVGPAAQLELRL